MLNNELLESRKVPPEASYTASVSVSGSMVLIFDSSLRPVRQLLIYAFLIYVNVIPNV